MEPDFSGSSILCLISELIKSSLLFSTAVFIIPQPMPIPTASLLFKHSFEAVLQADLKCYFIYSI